MSAVLKKIPIDELQVGMFLAEMDISWISSPFLLHYRAIKSENDIVLLKKAGAKMVTIDLQKSQFDTKNKSDFTQNSSFPAPELDESSHPSSEKTEDINSAFNMTAESLNEELKQAEIIKEKALQMFKDINTRIKNNQSIPVSDIEPVIDDTIDSLLRNSQALLTLMHLKRFEEKLFSHSFSVMTLALTFAMKDPISREDLKNLGLAALLHDIGWVQLPLNLLGKATKYTKNEMKVVQQHLKIAEIIFNRCENFPATVKPIIMNHHERIDGSGYPEHLKSSQLDPLSNILIVCDYYDELVHGLSDQPGFAPSEALRFLYKNALQNKLEKSYVEHLIRLLSVYPLTSAIELTSGEQGIVVEVNPDEPLLPIVKIMYSSAGKLLKKPEIIELEKDDKNRQIKGIVDFCNDKDEAGDLMIVEGVP